tara:strand:+ start:85 stop:489 length:405 start_codon:yes stop_codon:yes gene_type:complete
MPTQFGITYEIIEVDNPGTFTVKADGANTTVEAVLTDNTQSITLNFNNTTSGDPDVVFNTETSLFQYFDDDYLENNPSTTSPIISYVGQYFSDTVSDQNTFEIEDEAPSGTGTRFSSTSLSFDNTNVKFDRVFT